MDYEKAYKEALNRAKLLKYNPKKVLLESENIPVSDYIFPELKEEEDELTWLINYITEEAYCLSIDIRDDVDREILKKLQKSLIWLKKQCKNNTGISESTKQKLEDDLNKVLEKETPESWNEFLDKQSDQKHEWSEEDENGLQDALWAVKQAGTIAKDENDAGTLWYAEKWLNTIKEKVVG